MSNHLSLCKLRPARLFAGRALSGGGGLPMCLCAAEADNRLCVFVGIERTQTGARFREKSFFAQTKRFCLGITILKLIFNFGIR